MRIGVFFSGGKDSTLTAFLMQQSGFDPTLVTFFPKRKHSYMLQGESLNTTELQATAMNLEHHTFEVSGIKEQEIDEMLKHVERLGLEGIAAGAIESEYQRQRVHYIGNQLEIPTYAPLWKKMSAEEHYKKMDIRFSKVAAEGLGPELLGEQFFPPQHTHPLLEGGEGETIVLDAPFFSQRIHIQEAEKVWQKGWGEWVIKKARLAKK